MKVSVIAQGAQPHLGSVSWPGHLAPCALGRSGLTQKKQEGDGGTPTGVFPLRRVFYRPDRGARPETALPVSVIGRQDGWCDAPGDPAYNRPVTLPHAASAETLWRTDRLYDVFIEIGYNDDPIVPGKGSCIFFHLAREDYAPTEGCVAVSPEDMRALLARLQPGDEIEIAA